ncbi:MAG: hypothetical protein JO112_06630 [Planctomycetes bacterium]|nr:hypothetical protein [Planctomycetota bacterium]
MTIESRKRNLAGRMDLDFLESRDLLGVRPSAAAESPGKEAPGSGGPRASVWTHWPSHQFDLFLQGEDLRMASGWPRVVTAKVFAEDARDGSVLGWYEETLAPIQKDGQVIGFTGQAVLKLWLEPACPLRGETLTLSNQAFLHPMASEVEAWELTSAGSITGVEGEFPDLRGGFTGSALLCWSGRIRYEARLHFNLRRAVGSRGEEARGREVGLSRGIGHWRGHSGPLAPQLRQAWSPEEPQEASESSATPLFDLLGTPPLHPPGTPRPAATTGPVLRQDPSAEADWLQKGGHARPFRSGRAEPLDRPKAELLAVAEVGRTLAEIRHRRFRPTLAYWVDQYSALGWRDPYLWKWCRWGVEVTTLSCVAREFREDLCDTKVLAIILNVLIDDVADRHGEDGLLEYLLNIPYGNLSLDMARLPAEQQGYAHLAGTLWQEIQKRLQTSPCFEVYNSLLRYDYLQLCNSMRYSHLLNQNPALLNLLEHDLYLPHQMNMMISATFDLMGSPSFNSAELGKLREATWHAQCMGRIGNLISTWERELTDGDYTSGVYARALSLGDLTLEDLQDPDPERIKKVIREKGHENYFLDCWQEHRRALLRMAGELKSCDLGQLVGGLQRLLQSQMASRGNL